MKIFENEGRCYAVQLGIEQNKQTPHPDNKNTLIALLDRLESDKNELGNRIEQEESKYPYVKQFANKIFDKADSDDRAGKSTRLLLVLLFINLIIT